jgi:hypothetical protein
MVVASDSDLTRAVFRGISIITSAFASILLLAWIGVKRGTPARRKKAPLAGSTTKS